MDENDTNIQLIKAEQQLTGFAHAARGFGVISLIEAMGLTAQEWEQLRTDMKFLPNSIFNEIEDYFTKGE